MKLALESQMQEATKRSAHSWCVGKPGGTSPPSLVRTLAAALLLAALLVTAPLAFTPSAQAASVGLGTADSFAVLGGSTVTNTGPSVISGDLGVIPGASVTGFPPGIVTAGTIHAADGVASQAKIDLTTAYDDAAGRSSTATISDDLAGRRLTSGVYTSASSLGLTGDLTLDGLGDPNAVFVFQAGTALTVGSGSRVLLIGGAQACNVFWQVGSSASIGSGSALAGSILALASISLDTGATLRGRALARNGAVTLDSNIITKAPCGDQSARPPSVTDTWSTTAAGQTVSVNLIGTDVTGAPLTYVITSGPSHGTLGPIDQGGGTITYTPNPGYTGPDSFGYHVGTSNGTSNAATAAIMVIPGGPGTIGTSSNGARPGTPAAAAILAGAGANGTSARLLGPTHCITGPFRVSLTGRGIAQVTFYVDGKRRKTVKAKAGQTVFSLGVNALAQKPRVHRVTAKVRFTAASGATARTLRFVYQRCSRAAAAPQFAG